MRTGSSGMRSPSASIDERSSRSDTIACSRAALRCAMSRKRACASSSCCGSPSVSRAPITAASGVRSSWLTLATKSMRTCSSRRIAVTSDRSATAPENAYRLHSSDDGDRRDRQADHAPVLRGRSRIAVPGAATRQRAAQRALELGITDALPQRLAGGERHRETEHRRRGLVHEQHALAAVDGHDALRHLSQDRLDLACARDADLRGVRAARATSTRAWPPDGALRAEPSASDVPFEVARREARGVALHHLERPRQPARDERDRDQAGDRRADAEQHEAQVEHAHLLLDLRLFRRRADVADVLAVLVEALGEVRRVLAGRRALSPRASRALALGFDHFGALEVVRHRAVDLAVGDDVAARRDHGQAQTFRGPEIAQALGEALLVAVVSQDRRSPDRVEHVAHAAHALVDVSAEDAAQVELAEDRGRDQEQEQQTRKREEDPAGEGIAAQGSPTRPSRATRSCDAILGRVDRRMRGPIVLDGRRGLAELVAQSADREDVRAVCAQLLPQGRDVHVDVAVDDDTRPGRATAFRSSLRVKARPRFATRCRRSLNSVTVSWIGSRRAATSCLTESMTRSPKRDDLLRVARCVLPSAEPQARRDPRERAPSCRRACARSRRRPAPGR